MMQIVTADFETFYSKDFSLSKMTTEAYINDPRFEALMIGMKINDEPTYVLEGLHRDIKAGLQKIDWDNTCLVAHNAMFDAAILEWVFDIRPKVLLCTLSMGRALHGTEVGNSLDKLTQHYRLGDKGKEVLNALGKRREDFTPYEWQLYKEYCVNDVELTYKLFKVLQPRFNKVELKLIDMTLKMFTMPTLQLDIDVLNEHLASVLDKKEQLLNACGVELGDIRSDAKLAELLTKLGVEPPRKISATTGKENWAFAKTDEAFKELLSHPSLAVQTLVAARLGVKTTIEETRTERFIEMAGRRGGVLPVGLYYYGAKTGRWSAAGSEKANLQNLPRKSKLKEAIVAPPGHVIVGADLSNIELRVGLWYAGQMDKLQLLADGLDLYKDFASTAFGVTYEEVNDDQRFVGKTAQLSLIYQTGANKLRGQIKQMSTTDIGEAEAKRLVDIYRSEYSHVAAAWRTGEKALEAVRDNNFMVMGYNDLVPIMGEEGAKLPSGLFMRYPGLEQVVSAPGRKEWRIMLRKGMWDNIYGGKVFQGHTQALARCVMGEAMVRIAKRYPIALTIHDACYLVVEEHEADEALQFVIRNMKQAPAWMPGIPLDAEGGYGKNLNFKMKKVELRN